WWSATTIRMRRRWGAALRAERVAVRSRPERLPVIEPSSACTPPRDGPPSPVREHTKGPYTGPHESRRQEDVPRRMLNVSGEEAPMKVLIALDDSPHSEAALEFVRRVRWPGGSRVTVVSVVETAANPATMALGA